MSDTRVSLQQIREYKSVKFGIIGHHACYEVGRSLDLAASRKEEGWLYLPASGLEAFPDITVDHLVFGLFFGVARLHSLQGPFFGSRTSFVTQGERK